MMHVPYTIIAENTFSFFISAHVAETANRSTVARFILKGFSDYPSVNAVCTGCLLVTYAFGVLANVAVITVITKDGHLHTPMYFFLKNLSFLDVCYTSVTMPKAIVTATQGSEEMSFLECAVQLYLFFMLAATECFLLTTMACDRCVAIYRPLVYGVTMSRNLCWELVSTAWICGALYAIFHAINTFSLPFCGPNVIDHFFCDIPPVMRLSSVDYHTNEELSFIYTSCIILGACVLTLISYIRIISTIAKIQQVQGRWKAFSTCSSHLTTVLLFYRTGSSLYLRPTSDYSPIQARLAAVFYSLITPTLNPLTCCLRNKEMKVALKKVFHQLQRKNHKSLF
ncbi:olfactory receptor 1052-like [Diceros bicornis minor]|uniref:olfactory receptor 1052-like n=1 Tax=Diceros bicornis minor TaxID=77932 RepID=UPI0026F377E2|nr:olfactory receptor 1052-like [Diceros bicornis minor]